VNGKGDDYLVVWYQRKWKESWRKNRSIFIKWHKYPYNDIYVYTHTHVYIHNKY